MGFFLRSEVSSQVDCSNSLSRALFCHEILLARVSAVHHLIAGSRFGGRGPRSIGFC